MTRKIIFATAIAATAITLLLTLSNVAFSSPIGDEISITIDAVGVTPVVFIVIVDAQNDELFEEELGQADLTINVDDGMVWLEYLMATGTFLPEHTIHIEDLDWLDETTGLPIEGQITEVTCSGSLEAVVDLTGVDSILFFVDEQVINDLLEIHCEFVTVHDEPPPVPRVPVRDNVDVENIKLKEGQFRVIIDNAGIGGTSDVEVTWVFNEDDDDGGCQVLAVGSDGSAVAAVVVLEDDGALTVPLLPLPGPVPVSHNDVDFAEAILLRAAPDGGECEIESDEGQFVAVSTIGMGGPGLLITTNPP